MSDPTARVFSMTPPCIQHKARMLDPGASFRARRKVDLVWHRRLASGRPARLRARPRLRGSLLQQPQKFFEVIVHEVQPTPGLTGLDAGYEAGAWRAEQLASHLFEWLPEFALSYSESITMNYANAVEK